MTTMKFIRWHWYSEIQLPCDSVPKFWRHSDQSLNARRLYYFFTQLFLIVHSSDPQVQKSLPCSQTWGHICSPSPRDETKDIEAKNDAASLQSESKNKHQNTWQATGGRNLMGVVPQKHFHDFMILHLFHTEACWPSNELSSKTTGFNSIYNNWNTSQSRKYHPLCHGDSHLIMF